MVQSAHRAARAKVLDHCAFFRADVGRLPRAFTGAFDLIYNCLAHHHPEPAAAAASMLRCLRPGGAYCVVDPGPAWFNRMSAPFAARTDPGWIGFHTPDEFRTLFERAGFARTAWIELLPGFGLAVGQKDRGRAGRGTALAMGTARRRVARPVPVGEGSSPSRPTQQARGVGSAAWAARGHGLRMIE
jgi:SAM-dependent methyltransferase